MDVGQGREQERKLCASCEGPGHSLRSTPCSCTLQVSQRHISIVQRCPGVFIASGGWMVLIYAIKFELINLHFSRSYDAPVAKASFSSRKRFVGSNIFSIAWKPSCTGPADLPAFFMPVLNAKAWMKHRLSLLLRHWSSTNRTPIFAASLRCSGFLFKINIVAAGWLYACIWWMRFA